MKKTTDFIKKFISKESYEKLRSTYQRYIKNPHIYSKYQHYMLPINTFFDNQFMRLCGKKAGGYYSQFGQDFFLAQVVFPGKTDGVFLDIGANDPIIINNTYHFEQKGWTGLAFEPQHHLVEKYNSIRTTKCLPNAVGATNKTVMFHAEEWDALSSVSIGEARPGDYEVEQVRISDVCREHGIKHVDFMSLDVEDYELEAINGIDFDELTIDCIVVENNHIKEGYPDNKLRQFIESKGYTRCGRITIDDVFIKNDFWERQRI